MNLFVFFAVGAGGDAGDGFELADKMVLVFIAQFFRSKKLIRRSKRAYNNSAFFRQIQGFKNVFQCVSYGLL